MDYKGIKCPVCDKPFTENDDIVVCPSAVHRTTEAAIRKRCDAFSQICMKAGKTWAPPVPPDAPNTASELKDKECPNCGTLNAHSALFATSAAAFPHRRAG